MVDRLETYRSKRDFSITSEPSGTAPPTSDGWRFVVQRHRATRLHYDLRLEAAGVLLSWAVPKGPTLDPTVKRMAVHVEDHPLDYFDFEGVIPAGEYGGGDVIVWDWGTWSLAEADDPIAAVDAGDLHFDLDGEKLAGRFVLVERGADRRGKSQWLLLKKRDAAAEVGWDPEDHPRSVRSGRTNDEVAAAPAATWSSDALWVAPTADELAELDGLGAKGRWHLGEQSVALSGLDDAVLPGITRRQVIRHLATAAPAVLPYVHDHGMARPAASSAPAWLTRTKLGRREHVVADSPAALAWVASRQPLDLQAVTDRPTWAVIAFDGELDDVLPAAHLVRTALEHLGLEGRPVRIGAQLEVRVPIEPHADVDKVHAWVDQLATAIATTIPDDPPPRATDQSSFAVPFSVTGDGSVVTPLGWDELDDPPDVAIATAAERLSTAGDPLAPLIGMPQRLPRL